MHKIGVGLITCNAEHRARQSIPKIPNVDYFVVVNDGKPYPNDVYPNGIEVIQHSKNMCVGISKNDAMRYLIQKGADSIFLVEDDVLIKNPKVFEQYIKTAEKTGIWHLNYALQGPANRKQEQQGPMYIDHRGTLSQTSDPNPRVIIDYGNDIKLGLYPNSVGAFSYYHKGIIKAIGYHDEHFKNAFEHVEHTYRAIKAGLHPQFWWFADIADSYNYLEDIPGCIENSTIAHTPEWHRNFREAMEWYKYKHGFWPQQTPQTNFDDVQKTLKNIKTNYARNVL